MTEERLEREVVEQHRRLDALFAAVRECFVAGRGASALSAPLDRLQQALEVHFLQEDELYYPAIAALRPAQKARLQACVAAHRRLRELLRDLDGRAARGELAGALQTFEALAEDFRRHEVREEEVLHDLDRELGPAPEPTDTAR
jgi:iron-sulfur cluster repair protein YtfE (RIC family)